MGGAVCEVSIGCECCLRTGKKVFSMSVPSEMLLKMAPALLLCIKFAMVAASVAGSATGVKLPLPSFASLDALHAALQEVQALVGPALVKDVFECAQSAFGAEAVAGAAAGQVTALSDEKARALAAASGRIQRATGDSYKSFKALLEKNVPNKANYGERVFPTFPITRGPHIASLFFSLVFFPFFSFFLLFYP